MRMLYITTSQEGQLVTIDDNVYKAIDYAVSHKDEPKLYVMECTAPDRTETYYYSGTVGAVLTYTKGKLTEAKHLNLASGALLELIGQPS